MSHLTNMKPYLLIIFFALIICLPGCSERASNDADESYKLWAFEEPSEEISVIHGKYWQSGHFTREYIVYLELTATHNWKRKFFTQNHFIKFNNSTETLTDAPSWFKPIKPYIIWKQENNDNSICFEEIRTGRLFIHEMQL